jgi:hypothetical protein
MTVALLLALSACSEDVSDGPKAEGSGGGASGGSTQSASGGAQGGSTGGDAGNPPDACDEYDPTNSECGACTQTLDEFCDMPDECDLMATPMCQEGVYTQSVEQGCGLLKVTWFGDVGDAGTTIWRIDQNFGGAPSSLTGNLVYLWNNGKRSAGCLPEMTVGTEPLCNDWASTCPSNGLGGAEGSRQP